MKIFYIIINYVFNYKFLILFTFLFIFDINNVFFYFENKNWGIIFDNDVRLKSKITNKTEEKSTKISQKCF